MKLQMLLINKTPLKDADEQVYSMIEYACSARSAITQCRQSVRKHHLYTGGFWDILVNAPNN